MKKVLFGGFKASEVEKAVNALNESNQSLRNKNVKLQMELENAMKKLENMPNAETEEISRAAEKYKHQITQLEIEISELKKHNEALKERAEASDGAGESSAAADSAVEALSDENEQLKETLKLALDALEQARSGGESEKMSEICSLAYEEMSEMRNRFYVSLDEKVEDYVAGTKKANEQMKESVDGIAKHCSELFKFVMETLLKDINEILNQNEQLASKLDVIDGISNEIETIKADHEKQPENLPSAGGDYDALIDKIRRHFNIAPRAAGEAGENARADSRGDALREAYSAFYSTYDKIKAHVDKLGSADRRILSFRSKKNAEPAPVAEKEKSDKPAIDGIDDLDVLFEAN